MSPLITVGLVLALALFWVVGAYNRLVRLRSAAIEAFAALDEPFQHCVALVQSSFPSPKDDAAPALAGLVGAAQQFERSLQAARQHPLDDLLVRALAAALDTLHQAWSRWCSEPHDLAGTPVPPALEQQWVQLAQQADAARSAFNRQVQAYNQAIALFPASVLARLFRLRPAHEI